MLFLRNMLNKIIFMKHLVRLIKIFLACDNYTKLEKESNFNVGLGCRNFLQNLLKSGIMYQFLITAQFQLLLQMMDSLL